MNAEQESKEISMVLSLSDCGRRDGLSDQQTVDNIALRYAFAKAALALYRHYEDLGRVTNGDLQLAPKDAFRSDCSKIIDGVFAYQPARHQL